MASTSSSLNGSFVVIDNASAPPSAPVSVISEDSGSYSNTAKAPPSGYAHDWSTAATGGGLWTHGRHFVDGYGRVCLLRGVNLSGNCKAPVDHNPESFLHDHAGVTFVGRPFPLEAAHEHLARLRRWGLTFVRFLITWEAVEHAGPGQYDYEYLSYVRDLLSLFPQYGMRTFISMHQDVWSRFAGGSGAPAWTLEAIGFDLHKLEASGAAWLHGVRGGRAATPQERGLWPTGYHKLAASTMKTVFLGGDTFAPKLKVGAKSGQAFLQDAFFDCWKVICQHTADLEAVLGYQSINEPHPGYIGLQSLHGFDYHTNLHLGEIPSALQSWVLGAGHPTYVPYYRRSFPVPTKLAGKVLVNEEGISAWRSDGPTQGKCLWEMHGVWGWDEVKKLGVPLRESYFQKDPVTGKKIDWYTNFYFPFLRKWEAVVRTVAGPHRPLWVEPIPNEYCPKSWTPEHQLSNMVFAPHWYDLHSLFNKRFGNFTANVQALARGTFPLKAFYWGHESARENYTLQMRKLIEAGYESLGERPAFLGETGIPMDMNDGEAFKTGDFTWQAKMMDALMAGLERNLVGFSLWNYHPENDDTHGDFWNAENFSWFSNQRARTPSASYAQTDATLDKGARIIESVVRPYPAKVAGIPLQFHYEINTGTFALTWVDPIPEAPRPRRPWQTGTVDEPPLRGHPPITSRRTEFFVPVDWVEDEKEDIEVTLLGAAIGAKWWYEREVQTLYVETLEGVDKPRGSAYRVSVRFKGRPQRWELRAWYEDLMRSPYGMALLVLFFALLMVFETTRNAITGSLRHIAERTK